MKILSIIGARPQFIKCAPLSRELRKEHEEILLHTGQRYDHGMSEIFFEEMEIPGSDHNRRIGSGNHGEQTGKMHTEIEKVLIKEDTDRQYLQSSVLLQDCRRETVKKVQQ